MTDVSFPELPKYGRKWPQINMSSCNLSPLFHLRNAFEQQVGQNNQLSGQKAAY